MSKKIQQKGIRVGDEIINIYYGGVGIARSINKDGLIEFFVQGSTLYGISPKSFRFKGERPPRVELETRIESAKTILETLEPYMQSKYQKECLSDAIEKLTLHWTPNE